MPTLVEYAVIRSIVVDPDTRRPVVLLGLVEADLERLVRDQNPIVVNLAALVPDQSVDLPDLSISVFYADAEAVEAMRQHIGEPHGPQTEGEPRDDQPDRNRRAARRRVRRRGR